jgi:hypothetical protein
MSPLQVGKRVGTKMEKEIVFHIVPGQLGSTWLRLGRNTIAKDGKREKEKKRLDNSHKADLFLIVINTQ